MAACAFGLTMLPTVSVVLRAVGGVDLVVHVVRFDEENVLVDAAGFDVGFVARLGAAEP